MQPLNSVNVRLPYSIKELKHHKEIIKRPTSMKIFDKELMRWELVHKKRDKNANKLSLTIKQIS